MDRGIERLKQQAVLRDFGHDRKSVDQLAHLLARHILNMRSQNAVDSEADGSGVDAGIDVNIGSASSVGFEHERLGEILHVAQVAFVEGLLDGDRLGRVAIQAVDAPGDLVPIERPGVAHRRLTVGALGARLVGDRLRGGLRVVGGAKKLLELLLADLRNLQ